MEFIKKFKSNIIVLSIFIFAFLITLIKNLFFTRYIHYESILIALVPLILYSISLYIVVKNNKKIKWTRFSNFFNLILFLLIVIINFFYISFKDSTGTIKNISSYNRILRIYNYDENPLINHFPVSIPKDASDIEFLEHPQFLQGSAQMYLKYKLPEEKFKNLDKKLIEKNYKEIDNFSEVAEEIEIPKSVKEFLNNGSSKYKIFLVDKEDYENNLSNGGTFGIALNYSNSSVMYWSESL